MNKRRIIVLSLIALVLLAALGWKGYGWWLKHKLESYRAELASRGEKLTVAELMADRKSPEHNSASLFLSSTAYLRRDGILNTNLPSTMRLIAPGRAMIGWQSPVLVDFYEKATNTWDELAAELDDCQEGIVRLHEIVEHPEFDFGLDYSQGFNVMLPHLSPLKGSAQVLSAAAMLELHRGNSRAAAQHIRAMLALCKGLKDEQLVISQLVRIAIIQITIKTCWEYLQTPDANEADLKQIQADLELLALVAGTERSFEMERVVGGMTIRHFRNNGGVYDFNLLGAGGGPAATTVTEKIEVKVKKLFSLREIRKTSNELLWESALSYEDEFMALQGMQVIIESCRSIHTNKYFAPALTSAAVQLEAMGQMRETGGSLWFGEEDLSLETLREAFSKPAPMMLKTLEKTQFTEASRALTVTAIALKRYQLRNRELPDALVALVPEYLPTVPIDPVDGQPLRYQRKPDGSFLLYSIGEDGVDDGGDATRVKYISSTPHMQHGRDWVWPQPATPEEIQAWEADEKK